MSNWMNLFCGVWEDSEEEEVEINSQSVEIKHKLKGSEKVIQQLQSQLNLFDKREKLLGKKIQDEDQKIKDFLKKSKRKKALECLKLKKKYENQVENISRQRENFESSKLKVEEYALNEDTLDVQTKVQKELRILLKGKNINDIEKVIGDIDETLLNVTEINRAMSSKIGVPVNSDVDDFHLESELDQFEKEILDEQLMEVNPSPVKLKIVKKKNEKEEGGEDTIEKLEQELDVIITN